MSNADYDAVHARGGPLEPGLSDEQEAGEVYRRAQIARIARLAYELAKPDTFESRDIVRAILDEMLDALD